MNEDLDREAYHLGVNKSGVEISASALPGFVFGVQSLRQLLPKEIENASEISNIEWLIPHVEITDAPHYSYRGSMLDVSRHFFEKDYIKKHIDRMVFLKLNTLHFHLVDDQGWRIEIKKYPKLTEVKGFSTSKLG